MFGNLTEDIKKFKLDFGLKIKQSMLLTIVDEVRRFSSIYKQAGSVHDALFKGQKCCSTVRMLDDIALLMR